MGVRRTATDRFSTIQTTAVLLVALDVMLAGFPTAVKAESLCAALVTPLGYPCDRYTIQTPDGFLLGMYNIPSKGRPVLLFHGFQAAGDNWFLNNPEESLGPILVELGYDVWIGNNRNVPWSNGHIKYGYNDTEYWDWTWDELAKYDILSSIDFVHSQRGNTPVSYVGHSQGTMTFLAALSGDPSLRAQVDGKIRLAVLLAPFAYLGHITAPVHYILGSSVDSLLPLLGIGPVDTKTLLDAVCKVSQLACDSVIDSLIGSDNYVNDTRTPVYLTYFPQVTSGKNYNHYGQVHRSQKFQKYDKGPIGNLLSYGSLWAPLYDLSKFPTSFPVQMFAGGIDGLADPEDFQITLSSLPKNLNKEVHYFPKYGHLDFIIGDQAYVDVYPLVNSFLSAN